MKSTSLFKSFFESEKAGGFILLFCTILSLIIANSEFSSQYISFWKINVSNHSIEHWINDGLMTIFFLLIGLELEREVYIGELSKLKDAILPISAAIGGMIVPALLFYLFNKGTSTQDGIGIPMATDIAFAIGILSLLGNKVPISVKIFLTALAVIDDLGAIILIAIFYTKTIYFSNLLISLLIFGVLLLLNRLKVTNLLLYLTGGFFMWYFMLNSGVHATITGVLLAFALPFGNGSLKTISSQLQHWLHHPVAFFIIPLFALCNTAIVIDANWTSTFSEKYALGIIFGLVLGKPIGIFLFTFLTVKLKLAKLPLDISWKTVIGIGFLGGIGFTMSIFVTLLAFDDLKIISNSKFMILTGSLLAGVIGFIWLYINLPNKVEMLKE